MKSLRTPRRYRLKDERSAALRKGHPWIFRDKLSTVVQQFADGQWLELLDSRDRILGYGIYHQEGGVGIRMLRHEAERPDRAWLQEVVRQAVKERKGLLKETDAYRLINGENDSLPGIVLDVYAGYGVLQTYQPAVDALGRYVANLAYRMLGLQGLVWKHPHRRVGDSKGIRVLRGQPPPVIRFREGPLELAADILSGHKSGTFLDLRGLRRWLAKQSLKGQQVLNLFSYTGATGLACCVAGARTVYNVDAARPSLEFGQRYHQHPAQRWLCEDIFPWLKQASKDRYNLIIVDPPCMAFNKTQVPKALATYRRLYQEVARRLERGGQIVACCCTSRISSEQFESCLGDALKLEPWPKGLGPVKKPGPDVPFEPRFTMIHRMAMEVDHQPGFAEANYLKIVVLRSLT